MRGMREYIQGRGREGETKGGSVPPPPRLVVVATDDSAASSFRLVGRTILLVLAAAQAVDIFIGLNELNKVRPVLAVSTTGSLGIILSTLVIFIEIVRVAINAAC